MKKTKVLKVLRTVFYCIGFPLLLLLTAIGTMPFFGEPVFKASCANGLLVIFIMWAVVEIVRLIMKFACKKNQMAQTIIVAVVGLIIMVAPVILFDELVGPKIDASATQGANFELAYIVNEGVATVVSADTTDAVIIPTEFADVSYQLLNGSDLETFNYQLGKYTNVTNKVRVDKALYRKFLDSADDFMDFYGINKWYNYEDFYFDNYTGFATDGTPTTDGHLLGVENKLNAEIEYLQKAVVSYHRAYVANGNSEVGLDTSIPATYNIYQIAIGETTSTSHMSLSDLYILKTELATKAQIYPLFVARNYIYIFIGLVALSTILVGYCNEKLRAIAEGKED
ncbi:MAG: hypothetical protein PHE93_02230 [Clostridia bacterium]|nr:hypothetical protein [Clostridia bacterium]